MVMSDMGGLRGKRKAIEPTLTEEKRRHVPNAERDLQKHFSRLGLSLPVPIRKLEHILSDESTVYIEYLNPSDWLTMLVNKFPPMIAGGNSPLGDQLLGFWECYEKHHPNHAVYTNHCQHLHRVIPVCFWGDEGRGPRRSPYLEGTLETPLGLSEQSLCCKCEHCLQTLPRSWLPPAPCDESRIQSTPHQKAVDQLGTNYTGHSYLKRYFLFGLPGFLYDGEPSIIKEHLEIVSNDLVNLFNHGFSDRCGTIYYAALIGSKGDLKFQAQTIASLSRSYSNMGTKNLSQMCSLCAAGSAECPMEDVQLEPGWQTTLFYDRPWEPDNVPIFTRIPYDSLMPENLYKLDFFHCFKVGVGRDLVGSTIIWLSHLGVFDYANCGSYNIDDRLCRAHCQFKLFCCAEKYSPALRSFTKSFLNAKTFREAAWSNSKGSDTMILLKWLRFLLGLVLENSADYNEVVSEHIVHLQLLKDVIHNGIQMCDLVYTHNLFLPRPCASRLYLHIMVLIRGYKKIAGYCLTQGFPGFRIKAKLHALAHISFELRDMLKKPVSRILNPLIWACEMNEDHIGHVARLSRKLNTKTLGLRLAQRYLLKSRALMRRHMEQRKIKRTSRKPS